MRAAVTMTSAATRSTKVAEQDLIIPRRLPNGYREYDHYLINRVNQIRGLIDSGLPTKIIKQILPCVDKRPTIHPSDATPELLAVLEEQRDRMTQRIDCLTRNRDASITTSTSLATSSRRQLILAPRSPRQARRPTPGLGAERNCQKNGG